MVVKECSKCGSTKNGFYANRKSSDGMQSWCKRCHCADTRVREKNNPGFAREYQPRSRLVAPSCTPDAKKKYRSKYKEQEASYARSYREKNRDRMNANLRRYFKENPEMGRIGSRKRRAIVRGCEGTHTKDQIAALFKKQ